MWIEHFGILRHGADPRVSANCRLQATSQIYAQNSPTNINYGMRKVLTPYLPEISPTCLGRDGDDSMASRLVTPKNPKKPQKNLQKQGFSSFFCFFTNPGVGSLIVRGEG